jgi:hypothetical protein
MAIEESFRDLHHTWKLRKALARLPEQSQVEGLLGIALLAYNLQVELGLRLSQSPEGNLRRRQWTTTNRLSLFWCGGQLLRDPGYDWSSWLRNQWHLLAIHALDDDALANAA